MQVKVRSVQIQIHGEFIDTGTGQWAAEKQLNSWSYAGLYDEFSTYLANAREQLAKYRRRSDYRNVRLTVGLVMMPIEVPDELTVDLIQMLLDGLEIPDPLVVSRAVGDGPYEPKPMVLAGSIGNGYQLFGPFDTYEYAAEWAQNGFESYEVFTPELPA